MLKHGCVFHFSRQFLTATFWTKGREQWRHLFSWWSCSSCAGLLFTSRNSTMTPWNKLWMSQCQSAFCNFNLEAWDTNFFFFLKKQSFATLFQGSRRGGRRRTGQLEVLHDHSGSEQLLDESSSVRDVQLALPQGDEIRPQLQVREFFVLLVSSADNVFEQLLCFGVSVCFWLWLP